VYLLDANIFITAKNSHYGFDIVPGFWDWLDKSHNAKILCSIEAVWNEIDIGKDDLTTWAAARRALFVKPDAKVTPSLTAVAAWASAGAFTNAAVADFLASADYELVAYAHAYKHVVVTYEQPQPNAKKRILIPNACLGVGVKWMNPYTMLRNESAKFVLP
jgi:hypothetical protein